MKLLRHFLGCLSVGIGITLFLRVGLGLNATQPAYWILGLPIIIVSAFAFMLVNNWFGGDN